MGSARPEASTAARAAQALGTGVTREAGVERGRAARRASAGWPGARVAMREAITSVATCDGGRGRGRRDEPSQRRGGGHGRLGEQVDRASGDVGRGNKN